MIEAVDLFCGAGGLTAGLRQSGVLVKAGYDTAEECRHAYAFNNGAEFVCKDVGLVKPEELESWYTPGAVRLLAGCAPCQPFSTYNQGRDTTKDDKWPLLRSFAALIRAARPELVTMENVPDVVKHEVYHDFVKNLHDLGYHVWADRVSCIDYGLPQHRRRHVMLASLLGPIEMVEPTHSVFPKTVKDAIGHLPPIESGKCDPNDPLHKASKLNDINMRRMKASKPGGTWKDWPEDLVTACHKRNTGKSYIGVYGRMEWEKPSPTMTTLCYGFGNGRFGHPEQDRAISLREAALLQGFPDDYQFTPSDIPVGFKDVGRMIGNAVPVRLGEVIGMSFVRHMEGVTPKQQTLAFA